MSLAKTKTTKAAKEYTCEKCREAILKGESYISYKVGFRSRYVHRRHDLPGCRPRPSERESSKLADVYAAQESAQDALDSLDSNNASIEELESIRDEFAQAIRDVAEEYSEASTDDNGTVFNVDAEDRAYTLESAADEIENVDLESSRSDCQNCDGTGRYDQADREDGGADCDECEGSGSIDDVESAISTLRDAVDSVELP